MYDGPLKLKKTELALYRDESYIAPLQPARRCGNCAHYWNALHHRFGSCHAVEIRGKLKQKAVEETGTCGLWQPKQEVK